MDITQLLSGTGGTYTVAGGALIFIGIMFRLLVLERRAHTDTAARFERELEARAASLKDERTRWSAEREELLTSWRAEIARINSDHDTEIAEMRAKIARLEAAALVDATRFTTEVDRLNARLDAERELRRAAQDSRP